MRFTKMQGIGNDYVYLDCTRHTPDNLPELAVRISDRHFGVGSDGLICVCPSDRADFRMRMFNADGSEGKMCGNGLRCVGKFVYDKGLTTKRDLTIETMAGVREVCLVIEEGRTAAATADMGEPVPGVPLSLDVGGKVWQVLPVSMGNPHIVTFLEGIDGLELPTLGPALECHPAFPDRTNTEFVEVLDRTHLRMRVWERGSGETLACGTGACAALVAAVLEGRTERSAIVQLRGGELSVRWSNDNHIYMTGPAVTVFEGDYPDCF